MCVSLSGTLNSKVELEQIELPNTEALGAGMYDNQW